MIIIKIIILYFIQIRHTDNFPSTGSRLVQNNMSNINTIILPVLLIEDLVSSYVSALLVI